MNWTELNWTVNYILERPPYSNCKLELWTVELNLNCVMLVLIMVRMQVRMLVLILGQHHNVYTTSLWSVINCALHLRKSSTVLHAAFKMIFFRVTNTFPSDSESTTSWASDAEACKSAHRRTSTQRWQIVFTVDNSTLLPSTLLPSTLGDFFNPPNSDHRGPEHTSTHMPAKGYTGYTMSCDDDSFDEELCEELSLESTALLEHRVTNGWFLDPTTIVQHPSKLHSCASSITNRDFSYDHSWEGCTLIQTSILSIKLTLSVLVKCESFICAGRHRV